VNICTINVGASVGNRSLMFEIFSYYDVFFIVDLLVGVNRGHVDGDIGNIVLVSFVDSAGGAVYVQESLLDAFDLVYLGVVGCIISFMGAGME